jgi:uncharacterized oxidoreductase
MNTSSNTVLITGGATGIGLALAERFMKAGSKVIVCGRREDKLQEAKSIYPQLHTRVCDVSSEIDRIALLEWIKKEHPHTNVLVNNAGVQRRMKLTDNTEEWSALRQEIAINFEAPVHLSMLFIPYLQQKKDPCIINISSGLAFVPGAFAPVYSATKAAVHSFTMSLRHQLSKTNIKVVEIAPPAVNTDLGGAGLHTFGVPLNEFADGVFARLEGDETEIGYGTSEKSRKASREEIDEAFRQMNSRF